ncbi:hypothetical protein GYH30_012118 [Glycine max]|uniref:Uncharacterized protein n=1 Tax=Glycine max TaxID=3847 RepID=A0A0R0JSZ4_SOYBN|nr:hypothetical protein GYH30_012118 [Glycine max]
MLTLEKVCKARVSQFSNNLVSNVSCVLPPSVHMVKSAASKFLLEWLFQHEHEHRQWSAAVSLGLISSCLHVTDHKERYHNITGLLEVFLFNPFCVCLLSHFFKDLDYLYSYRYLFLSPYLMLVGVVNDLAGWDIWIFLYMKSSAFINCPLLANCFHLLFLNLSLSANLKEVDVTCLNLCFLNLRYG